LAKEITDAGGKALFIELEVTDQEHWDAAVEQIRERAGALHILMNIVGSNALVMLPEVEIEAWNKMFEVNVTATLRGIQTCAPLIKERLADIGFAGQRYRGASARESGRRDADGTTSGPPILVAPAAGEMAGPAVRTLLVSWCSWRARGLERVRP